MGAQHTVNANSFLNFLLKMRRFSILSAFFKGKMGHLMCSWQQQHAEVVAGLK